MARNTLAGTKTGKSETAKYYQENPEARKKKQEYDKKTNAKPSEVAYRSELNKKNRDAGTYGNKDGKDMSHTKSGKMVSEDQSKNRARNGSNGKSTKK